MGLTMVTYDIFHSYIVTDSNSHIQAPIRTRVAINNVKLMSVWVFLLLGVSVNPNSD